MLIITTLTTIIILFSLNINPITAVMDNFNIGETKASGQVLGVVEKNKNNLEKQILDRKEVLSPVVQKKDLTPVKKDIHNIAPEISARSVAVMDLNSRTILYEKEAETSSSIASITKLMTALVVMDINPDFSQTYIMPESDRREGGRIFLYLGDEITINDLFNISLVGSGNTATIALVHSLDLTENQFVIKMNAKVKELGLLNTQFVDPIGLSSNNISTAYEVIEIIKSALENEKIRKTVIQPKYVLKTKQGKTRIIESTDQLLKQKNGYDIVGGKTGYLGSAGFCFAGQFIKDGHEIISVVLGSDGVEQRFIDTDELVHWAFNNYLWP